MPQLRITKLEASLIFVAFTAYFFILLYTLFPFLKSTFSVNSALYWFVTGYFLFVPILCFAIIMVKREENKGMKEILLALNIKPFTQKDWIYAVAGLLFVFVFTGIILGVSFLLNKYMGIRPLSTTPWFMEMKPFQGNEKLLLLIWLPMFCFNIIGEEVLWRGYIQARLPGKHLWLLCSGLWLIFHAPFGIDLIVLLIPIFIVVPYVFSKTKNTLVGIFIHGIYNGPLFVAVALGLLK